MNKKMFLSNLIGFGAVVAIILSSCTATPTATAPATQADTPTSASQAAPATEVPTNTTAPTTTAVPTNTATPVPVATATQAGNPTATGTAPVSASGTAQVVANFNAYCRKGPAYGYDAITFLTKGNAYNVIGRDSQSTYWQIQAPGNVTCWVLSTSVTPQGAGNQVAVVSVPALPGIPGGFVASYRCDVSGKTLHVILNWAAVNNANGYRLFRNGDQIAALMPTQASFDEYAKLGVNLVYGLEAYNDYGTSEQTSASVPACK